MIITQKKLHFFLIIEVLLLNCLIIPLSINNIKGMYINYNMFGSYLIIIGLMISIARIFNKYFKPYLEKYYSDNKIMKFICNIFDISYDPKKIIKLKKSDCIRYIPLYAIFILFFYPILFLANLIIINAINLYKIIKSKVSELLKLLKILKLYVR